MWTIPLSPPLVESKGLKPLLSQNLITLPLTITLKILPMGGKISQPVLVVIVSFLIYDLLVTKKNKFNSFKYRQLQSCKCFKLRKASRIVTQFYDRKLKSCNIKITQFSILSFIATSENKTMNSLSDDLLMDRTTLTRSLEILFKDKLIKNIKTDDARKRIVKLTDKGYELLERAIPLWKEAEEEILDESKKYDFSVL